MRLVLRPYFIGFVLFFFFSIQGFSQNQCPGFFAVFPDTVCIGQPFQGTNLGPTDAKYQWDFCTNDIQRTPSASSFSLPSGSGNIAGIDLLEVNGKFVAFFASSTGLFRLNFDTSLLSNPIITNLGNLGGVLTNGSGLKIKKNGNNYIGFFINKGADQLVRLNFGADIYSTPSTQTIAVQGLGAANHFEIYKENDKFFGFAASPTSQKLFVLSFGNSLVNTPVINNNFSIAPAGYLTLGVVADCSGSYVFLADASSRLLRVSFGSTFENPNPVIANLPVTPNLIPGAITFTEDRGRKTILLGTLNASTLGIINFGNSYSNPINQVTTFNPGFPSNVQGISGPILNNNGSTSFIYTALGSSAGRLTFPNGTCSLPSKITGFLPPLISQNSAGKIYVNYKSTFSDGREFVGSDSIVISGSQNTQNFPSFDWITDDQCISRATRFFSQVNPPGNYSYRWTFPGGVTSNQANTTRQFTDVGVYPVSLTVRGQGGCGVSTVTKNVKIFPNPSQTIVSNFTNPTLICTKDSILFSDASTPGNTAKRWLWDFGNNQTFNTQNVKFYFPISSAGQNIQVSFKASDSSGCGTAISKNITPLLGADINYSVSQFCEGQATNFQNSTPNPSQINFLWTFGDTASGGSNTSTSGQPLVQHLFSDSGLFKVSLRGITSNGCSSTVFQDVRIFENPRTNFSTPSFAAPGVPVNFTNTSQATRQTLQTINWNFGNPGSGANNTSSLLNPSHVYSTIGQYTVSLSVTTNQNCSSQAQRTVIVYPNCPQVIYDKDSSSSGNFDTLIVKNQTTLVSKTNIDFCAGDLELTPILQTQQTGTPPIASATQVIPVKDKNQWIGFIPSPPSNATVLWKANFGNSLNNDISNFSSSLGTLQSRFPTPVFFKFIKEDTNWYALASNGDARLWRVAFGSNIQNDSPLITEIPLPTGTLINPYNAQIIKYKDTTFVFVVNSANQSNNTFVRLRFNKSIVDTPNVFVLNNPPVLQNSNGFFGVSFILDCDKWYGYLIGTSQLYRLSFGNSLNRIPTAVALTGEITAGISSPNAFNSLRGISLLQDKGTWYGLINTNTANIFKFRLARNILQPLEGISNLGNFGLNVNVGPFNYVYENSEFFGLGITTAGTVLKFKFPNRCSATVPFVSQSNSEPATTIYQNPGKNYITITSETAYGAYRQVLDSVSIAESTISKSCFKTELNHPEELCFDFKFKPNLVQSNLENVEWDFCTGDFALPPNPIGTLGASPVGGPTGNQVVQVGSNYYSFVCSTSGLFRINLQGPDGVSPSPVTVNIPSGTFNTPSDFKIFKEGNNWFALLIFLNGESMVRLNFGADITNATPNFAIINLAGILNRPRGLSLFEDKGVKYAAIANQNNGTITILNFGSTYRNIPNSISFNVPNSLSLFKVSIIRDCNIWHAFLTDQLQDSVYQLTFNKGLESAPIYRMFPMFKTIGIQAVKDGNDFFLFGTKTQPNLNNLLRFSFGNSLGNNPKIDSLGNFAISGPTSGINNIQNFQIYKNELSENFLFGYGAGNGVLYRLKFQNRCSAAKPIFAGDTVPNQSYGTDGKYYFAATGFDKAGNQYSGYDSVIVKNQVVAGFEVPGNRCKGEPVIFDDTSVPGTFTNIVSWKWNFGDTTTVSDTSNFQNPTYTFSQPGEYPVKLIVREQFGCENELIRNIRIADKPRPDFATLNSGTLCTNDSIVFQDQSQTNLDPIIERNWEVRQNGNLIFSSTRQNPKFLFSQTGNYQVTLKIKGESQCDSSVTKTITVGGTGALVSFSNPAPCLGELIPFTANISGANPDSLAWFVDAAKLTNQTNFAYTFNSTNVFTVRLIAYSGLCANTFAKTIKVNARPEFEISENTALKCQGLPFNFNTSININEDVTYTWDFGDGTSDTVRNPVKIFQNAGSYTVRLNVSTENGCDAEKTLIVVAKRAPIASFTFDKACKDEPVTFTNTSTANGIPGGITSYLWEFGNLIGQTSTVQDPPPVFYNESPGAKTVRLTVRTAEDCPNTFTRIITIGTKLAANYLVETGCIGTPFRFYDRSDAGLDTVIRWEWSIGGLNFTTQNPIVEFDLQGTYDVRLKVKSKAGCEDEVIRTDDFTVLDSAKADFTISNPVFNNGTFTVIFRQSPTANPSYDYLWDFGDSTSSTSANPPPHIYARQGTFVVTMIATRAGTICSTRVQKVVNAILNPVQGLRLKELKLGQSQDQTSLAIEVENQSNVALRSFDIVTRIGNLTTQKEKWQGILLPGQVVSYPLKSDILTKFSQNLSFICVEARLQDPSLEISPEDNQRCISVDSVPSIVSLFPNPTNRDLTLDLNIPFNDPLEIKIINILGQEMQAFSLGEPPIGAYRKSFTVSGYPPGVYVIWFRVGKKVERRTFIIQNE
jgi:PKD repeat protein